MRIGINYPWHHYGWDFGPEVAGWGARAAFRAHIDADLGRLRAAGVTIVRWFVLGDGVTFGVGDQAPQRAGRDFVVRSVPALDPRVSEDFAALLAACARADVQLLPVWIGAAFAYPGVDRHTRAALGLRRFGKPRAHASRLPPGYVKGGRAAMLEDPQLRADFLTRGLGPLLEVSRAHARAVFAWELFNEPEWITRGGPLLRSVSARAMLALFREGGERVRRAGFSATVGFARAASLPRWLAWAGGDLGLDLLQVHHYPRPGQRLPHAHGSAQPVVLGEFATRMRARRLPWPWASVQHPWSDLPETQQALGERLALARARGYAAAFPWSLRAEDAATRPDTEALLRELAAFTSAPP